MTYKQIIINGVDVSGCDFFEIDSIKGNSALCCKILMAHGDFNVGCYKYSDCYYKQLQRKEQECKLLKASLKDINIVALVEENEKLKKKVEDYKHDRFCQGGCNVYQYDKIYKLKKTLEKIEQIVNQDIAFMGYSDEFNDLILNEINKVKE